jgi:hypothetical protein
MHVPRVIVLSPTANDISTQILIESGRSLSNNASEGIGQKGAIIPPKKETKKAVENPNVRSSNVLMRNSRDRFAAYISHWIT